MHYYKHHIGDFRVATLHLNDAEELAYRRMLELYYDTEAALPDDYGWIARRVRAAVSDVQRLLDDFFTLDADHSLWRHRRCDKEIAEYRRSARTARSNGKRGGRPAKAAACAQEPDGNRVGSSGKPDGKLTTNHKPLTNSTPRAERLDLPLGFAEFWSAFDHHKAKPTAEKAWRRIAPSSELVVAIVKAARAYAAATPDKAFRAHPATWLNRRGWEDELPVAPQPKSVRGVPAALDAGGVRVTHPERMPIPYDSPTGDCQCEACKSARRRRRAQ